MSQSLNKHILIVEDEGLIAADIQNQLRGFGYPDPAIVGSGEGAIQAARSRPFDLALMDIHLRGLLDGIEIAGILRREFSIPAVFLSAYSDQDTLNRAQAVAPLGYIVKPFCEGTLRSTVQMSLHRHALERGAGDTAGPPAGPHVRLTPREREVVRLVAEGLTAKEIAEAIHLAPKTVEFHKYNVMKKAAARGTADLTRFAIKSGIARL